MFEPAFLNTMENSPSKRYAVYHNNVTLSLKTSMKANFPCILKLVGDDFFDFLSATYLKQHPPTSKLMFQLGEQFPAFIKTVKQAEDLPFLSDIATLEKHLRLSFHGRDAESLKLEDFHKIPAESLGETRFTFAPAFHLLTSETPFISIYEDCMGFVETENISFEPEFGFVTRENFEVSVTKIDSETFMFLKNLSENTPLSASLTAISDAAKLLTFLINSKITIGYSHD